MSFLRRAFGGGERRASSTYGLYPSGDGYPGNGWYGNSPGNVPPNSWVPESAAGVAVTDYTALTLSTFYACVRLLADSIASLPWDSYRSKDNIRLKVTPQPSLLKSPCADLNVFDWKHVLMVSLAVRGNFYGLVTQRDGLGYPTDILPLHPDWVDLVRDVTTGKRTWYVNGIKVEDVDMFHIRAFTMPGYDIGLSPVQMFRQNIGLGLAAEQFGGKWFRDGAAPSSTLETDATLSPEQIKQTQQQWITSQGGRRLPAVLSGGFKWKPVTITPEESQFLETRQFQVAEIARMFGIPPHMVGDVDRSTSWGTGIEQMSIGFVTYTLGPWLARIEAALNAISPNGQATKFAVEGLLRGDVAGRYTAYETAINTGWMAPDEARALEDLPPIPGGKGALYRQPLNFGPLGYVPPKPVAAKPAPTPGATPVATPGKRPSKTPTPKSTPAKTPAKTPVKTPAKTPAK